MKRNKKYNPTDSVQQNLSNVSYKMKHNKLCIGDTYSMLYTLQHIFYVQGLIKDSSYRNDSIKYLNQIKTALDKALKLVISNCMSNEDGYLCGDPKVPIKVHHITRGKIMYFCEKYKSIHKIVPQSKHPSILKYARETLDTYLLIHNSPLKQFIHQ